MAGQSISAHADAETVTQLRQMARREGRTPSQLTAASLKLYLGMPDAVRTALRDIEAPSPLPLGPPEPVVQLPAPMPPPQGRVALLLHEDDLLAETLPLGRAEVAAVGGIAVPHSRSPAGCAPRAASWARGALADGLDRAGRHFGVQAQAITELGAWAEDTGCETVISPYAPVGWTADALAAAEQELADRGIRLHRLCRPRDSAHWPHAQSGFFAFAAKVER